MVQQIFDLSKLDSVEQGDSFENIGSPLRTPIGDPLGRVHTINAPLVATTYYERNANSYITSMVTQVEGGRYFKAYITRGTNDRISLITTTTGFTV